MPTRFHRILSALACAVSLALVSSGCARKKEPPPTMHKVEYSVRAEIVRLPAPGEPAPEIQARHEEIPSFVEKHGQPPTGMRAMTMPFPVAPGLDISGLSVGDKVMLTFEVDYSIESGMVESWRAVAIKALDADPTLELEGAGKPPTP